MASFRQQYKKQKKDLLQRHKESVAMKDASQFGSIIDNTKLPKGIGFWKCISASHIIDYIPFIAGPNMPKLFEGDEERGVKEGQPIWGIDLWVHNRVGVLEHPYVCPTKTNGLPCPICEDLQQNRDSYSDDEYNKTKAKRQTIHLIWCHDNSEEEAKGVQLWQIAHFFMEKHLKGISERPKGGGTVTYFDPDNGKNVLFTKEGSNGKWKFLHHRFDDRVEIIPDKILDQSFALDSVIKYSTYEEIYKAFYGTDMEESNEDANVPFDNSPEPEPEPEPEPAPEYEQEQEIDPNSCPVNGEFGVDHEELEACGECVNWDNCYAANQEMQPDPEPEPEPEPEPAPKKQSLRSRGTTSAPKPKPRPIRRPIRKK